MSTTVFRYFEYGHLPPHLQTVSAPLGELAAKFEGLLPDGPEKSTGMRKLLEAKDCFVRSALDMPKPEPKPETREPQTGRPAWQQRVIDERADLLVKCKAIGEALSPANSLPVSAEDRNLLRLQAAAMGEYLHILDRRIDRFF